MSIPDTIFEIRAILRDPYLLAKFDILIKYLSDLEEENDLLLSENRSFRHVVSILKEE